MYVAAVGVYSFFLPLRDWPVRYTEEYLYTSVVWTATLLVFACWQRIELWRRNVDYCVFVA